MDRREIRRFGLDKAAAHIIRLGGVSVIVLIVLVFIYLFRQVLPLFTPAKIELSYQQNLPADEELLYLSLEKQNEIIAKLHTDGSLSFYDVRRKFSFPRQQITESGSSLSDTEETSGLIAVGAAEGKVLIVKHEYAEDFSTGVRNIRPSISYPYGKEAIEMSSFPLKKISFASDEGSLTLITLDVNDELHGKKLVREVNLLTGEIVREEIELQLPGTDGKADFLKVFNAQQSLLITDATGSASVLDISTEPARLQQRVQLAQDARIKTVSSLIGEFSVLIADDSGTISQWFMITDQEGETRLALIRSFSLPSSVEALFQVQSSKSFLALTADGKIYFINAPAERTSLEYDLADTAEDIKAMALSPRANGLFIIENDGSHKLFRIDNRHPEISWRRLFQPIHYEGYDTPDLIWQSTAAANDFEPKFSLIPISFGTLKAAFYAMLFSTPLAIAAAIYTSFFMGPGLRRRVKPVIEMMEAFPTVILGFIAGLVLAPYFEKHLPGIFTLILFLPVAVVLIGFLYTRLPNSFRRHIGAGWESILLIPIFLVIGYFLMLLSPSVETFFFGGDMRVWLSENGIDYNQRNALVIGVAMGLAVIPSIYSIAEDALFSVPDSMVKGAYALGATPLQNVIGIVLPASMSGILSALMIGFGRAVGETMIVLMATGNTPVIDMSIFTGLRTLAANIAVEIPESPVGSSHFRTLFLCGLILFGFTFIVNTCAEVIRHRIRKKYAHV